MISSTENLRKPVPQRKPIYASAKGQEGEVISL